jgi:hypothetical protein
VESDVEVVHSSRLTAVDLLLTGLRLLPPQVPEAPQIPIAPSDFHRSNRRGSCGVNPVVRLPAQNAASSSFAPATP